MVKKKLSIVISFVSLLVLFIVYSKRFDVFFRGNKIDVLNKQKSIIPDLMSYKDIVYVIDEHDEDLKKQGLIKILYAKNELHNDHVYKDTSWWQTLVVEKSKKQDFLDTLQFHFSDCCKNKNPRKAVTPIYKKCHKECKMQEYETFFLNNQNVHCTLDEAKESILKNFFNNGRHKRKTKWEDFFEVIYRKFKNQDGSQCFSEGENVNSQYTYLYLLTKEYMYELGFKISGQILFLIRVNLTSDVKHFKIYKSIKKHYKDFDKRNNNYEIPFDYIWQHNFEKDKTTTSYSGTITFEEQLCTDIYKAFKNEETAGNISKRYSDKYLL